MSNDRPNQAQQPKKETNKLSEDQIINDILGNMPSSDAVAIEVPSRNKFYKLEDPAKPISLRPMTFEDERAMLSNKNIDLDVINLLLTRCVSNINIAQLLQMDKLFLIMKLRELSYGEDYHATIGCNSCKKDNNVTFKLSSLPVKFVEEELTNPISVHLSVLNKTLKVRFPRVVDENYFSSANLALNNLWRFVEEIDGHSQKSIISKIIPQLPLKDAHTLLDAVGGSDYGLDTKVRFVCDYCNHNEIMELPITADFFTEK